ncbi:nucleotide exchange factor GrpE [Streptomyces sp. NBC_01571]|uniref:nucleotide exchange factor GrpE n=1 Tax=unclassified Streptomyces TaxID=2593676 RepID=UPI002250542A|nr:nucleotide exchange factor GrpE [Streptomyces sp. NBC_01571]MCX4580173.1 nucleotide exchange factor GrpE [Streptomyces sp. NBC_01571]
MATGQEPVTPPEREQRIEDAADPAAPAAPARPEAEEQAAELDELRDRWRRALADLDNLRKRHAKELERVRGEERARTAAAWLPVLDNLERALGHADADPSAVLKGIETVRDQAVEVLRGLGYPRHEETGVPFDPTRHEVVGVVDDPGAEPNTVAQVVSPGYGADGNQLRPAFVMVSKRQE